MEFDIEVGEKLILGGKTLKGKNRIREHGDEWLVERIWTHPSPVSFDDPRGDGPFLLIRPRDGLDENSRWIATRGDPDFEIVGWVWRP